MSNNTVNIRGYLMYHRIGMSAGTASVMGWIYTDNATMGGRHPFIATGKSAEIITLYVRDHAIRPVGNPPDFPSQAIGVVMRGKLASYPNGSYLDVRNIHFFQASFSLERFVLNDLTLGGQLQARDGRRDLRMEQVGSSAVPALDVSLATDAPHNGGIHPVVLFNGHAQEVVTRLRQTKFQPFGATVGGRLITLPNGSLVQASFVCPDDERC